MKKTMWVGVVIAGSAMGCAQGPIDAIEALRGNDRRDSPASHTRVAELFSQPTNLHPTAGRLDGAVGPATGLAANAEYIDFYSDGTWTNSNLTVRGDNGSAMGILNVSGDIGELEVGEGARSCSDDYQDPAMNNGDNVIASFVGCANTGSPDDGWSYDAPADCTDLVVTEPTAEAPDGSVATLSVLAHWGADTGGGQERTVKATIHLAE